MSVPTRSCASAVDAPTWGVATTRGCWARRQSTGGSCACTSSAAPATRPLSSAASSASSSISSPRAAFTMRTPGLTLASASLPIRWRVSVDSVVCSVMKSERCSSSSSETQRDVLRLGHRRRHERVVGHDLHARAPGSAPPPRGRCGRSRRRRCACRAARRRRTTCGPTCPPSSTRRPAAMLRATASSSASVSSAVETRLPQRRVHDHDAAARGRVQVHVVDAHAGPADDAQVLRRVQHLGRDLAAAADESSRRRARRSRPAPRAASPCCTSTCQPSAFRTSRPRSVMPSRTRIL